LCLSGGWGGGEVGLYDRMTASLDAIRFIEHVYS
jgi:hypothetical protein